MKNRLTAVVCFLAVIGLSRAQEQAIIDDQRDDLPVESITVEDHVYVLDDSNYQNFVDQHPVALVEFYAPWCGHCKSLAPEYSKAAQELSGEKIALAKIDGSKYSDFARSYDIQGYPTLLVYLKGVKVEYDGARTAQGIIEHMRTVADPNYKPPEDSVLTLTEANFDSTLAAESLILVEFYAPWCGHCKRLKPEYERAARRLSQLPAPIKLAKIDATVEKELGARFDVKGYPTLIIFRNGGQKRQAYKGPRDENGIFEYMKSMRQLPSKVANTREALRKQLQNDVPTIVGLFDSAESTQSSQFDLFIDVAYDQFDANNHFVHVEDTKLIGELKQKSNSVLLFVPLWFKSKYEPNQYKLELDSLSTSEQLLQFITNHSAPLVGYRNSATLSLYTGKYPLVVVYYDVDFSFDNRKQTQIILEHVQKAAFNLRDQGVHFVIAKEEDNEQELKDLHLEDSGEDVNVAYFASPKRRYAMEPTDEFNAEVLTDFVGSVRGGQTKPVIKSAFVPDSNPVKNLWTVVGSTFEKLVLKSNKDSLIEFYAPWCGHCKQLEPIYKELAEKFQVESDRVQIMKIDATTNDYPEQFEVSGFPTIYYVRASDPSNPIAYDGSSRTLEDLTKFIHDQQQQQTTEKDEL